MIARVFVYGALRKGASNAWRMERATFVGEASVAGTLVKVDWYPGLVLEGETRVKGEVYEVDEETLRELDAFEGVSAGEKGNDEYQRVLAMVLLEDGRESECSLYKWQLGIAAYEVVANGDWLTVKV